MVDQVQEKLQQLNASLQAMGFPFRIDSFDPRELELLKKNARFMRNDTFRQLVDNIKRDGALSSLPLVYAGPDTVKPRVLSGNHRIMAAIEAGLKQVFCLVIDSLKTMDEQTAIALSHNALAGQDDLPTLKELYDSISDLTLKSYSGIDEELRKQLDAIKFQAISEPRLAFKNVSLLFLPGEIDELRTAAKFCEKELGDENTFVLMLREYQEFFNAICEVKEGLNIRNNAAALLTLIRRGVMQIQAEAEQKAALKAAQKDEAAA